MKTQNASKLNIKQCEAILSRDGLNANGTESYSIEEVKARLIYLQSRRDERACASLVRLYEEGIAAMFDWQNDREFWPLDDGEMIAIPGRIMTF